MLFFQRIEYLSIFLLLSLSYFGYVRPHSRENHNNNNHMSDEEFTSDRNDFTKDISQNVVSDDGCEWDNGNNLLLSQQTSGLQHKNNEKDDNICLAQSEIKISLSNTNANTNTVIDTSVSKSLTEQQYVILDQPFHHELKFQKKRPFSEEYEDFVLARRPIADILISFVWKKIKPATHAVTSIISKHVDHVVKQCQANCQCTWTAKATKNWLTGNNEVIETPAQCRQAKNSDQNSVSTSTYDNFLNTFIHQAKKVSEVQISIPLVPLVDIGRFDTSIENVEFEDQICFRLIQNAIKFAFGKFIDTFEKHFSMPEVPIQLKLDQYVDIVKNDITIREERARVRRERYQLS